LPKKANEEICALTVFRRVWKLLQSSSTIEEAKKKFKELVVELILGES